MALSYTSPVDAFEFPRLGHIDIISGLIVPGGGGQLFSDLSAAREIPYDVEDRRSYEINPFLDRLEDFKFERSAATLTQLARLASRRVAGMRYITIDTQPPVEGLQEIGQPPHRDGIPVGAASYIVVASGEVTYLFSSRAPGIRKEPLDIRRIARADDVFAANNLAPIRRGRPLHQSTQGTGNRIAAHFSSHPFI